MATKSKLVKPENTLKKKVGNGGFTEHDLVKAQKGIDSNNIDFRPLAQDLLNELDEIIARTKSGEDRSPQQLEHIMYPLMQLKSQGSLFQYPLISSISHATLDFLENIEGIDDNVLSIVVAYRNSVQAMIKLQLKNAQAKAGVQLMTELEQAFARYKKAYEKSRLDSHAV